MYTVNKTKEEAITMLEKAKENLDGINNTFVETDEVSWNVVVYDFYGDNMGCATYQEYEGKKVNVRDAKDHQLVAYKVTENGETKYYVWIVYMATTIVLCHAGRSK